MPCGPKDLGEGQAEGAEVALDRANRSREELAGEDRESEELSKLRQEVMGLCMET